MRRVLVVIVAATIAIGLACSTPYATEGPSTSSSGGDASSTSSSASSSGSVPAPVRYDALFATLCAYNFRCNADSLSFYADEAACVRFQMELQAGRETLPGIAQLTQPQIDACHARLDALLTCDGFPSYPECTFPGTLATGASCHNLLQCASGACARTTTRDECGKCVPAVARDGACDNETRLCEPQLSCIDDKCKDRIGAGMPCADDPLSCDVGLRCVTGTCAPGLPKGGDCPGIFECASPLACNLSTKKCVERQRRNVGDDCDTLAQDVCVHSKCVAKKCVPYKPEGQTCVAADGDCEFGLTCTNGKCAKPALPTCD
ncbi:MAG: hypothetical protein KIT84_38850 [Labilithrix sp.]|nr:hypothetical protein [Labilithrix sp.]MCW5817021.1 hypothetical protein [Labilithrix sp.]